ncbi:growth-regulating factor 6-like [Impatiens glandulifera]|uniref:growth-regulating factor 6-like n=1 Tax=Impatiens glandulifera TaxID=253017 RepID=UPI001FB10B5A|nr:growth-regulating factor 6-like [Impatiens glandulifera]
MMSSNISYPFTAIQWQELEHQALIYKYMIYGIPIPPDLLFNVRTAYQTPPHPHPLHMIGWNSFQMGGGNYGRKIDPEPGRCRRTDGKKWRCSKEAYPDSKYCERHMHRGRNHSRKQEPSTTTTASSKPSPAPSSSSSSVLTTTKPINSSAFCTITDINNYDYSHHNHSFLYTTPTNLLLDSSPPSSNSDNKNYSFGGTKEINDCWQLRMGTTTTTTGSTSPFSHLDGIRAPDQFQASNQNNNQMTFKILDWDNEEPQKVTHDFFDEWPRSKDSSTTQLSISIPNQSSHDSFMTDHHP